MESMSQEVYESKGTPFKKLVIDWVAAADGSFTATKISDENTAKLAGLAITVVETYAGDPAPALNYDVELVTERGLDVMGGNLHDRTNLTTGDQALPKIGTAFGGRPVYEPLTVKIENIETANAQGCIVVYFAR